MNDPIVHYERNRDVYDYISDRLDTATEYFADAPRAEQKVLLNKAVSFALISAQTSVKTHEHGYLNAIEASSYTELEEGLLDAGVTYHRNKAKYIFYNMTEPDYERVLDLYEEGQLDEMHRAIADEFKGVGLRKAAFAMALEVTLDKACIDTHVAQISGIDQDDIYNGVVVERYEQQWETIQEQWPELSNKLPKFIFQWVLFDADMNTVTRHNAWFESVPPDQKI